MPQEKNWLEKRAAFLKIPINGSTHPFVAVFIGLCFLITFIAPPALRWLGRPLPEEADEPSHSEAPEFPS